MNRKWLLFVILGLALILSFPAMTGGGGPVMAQGTAPQTGQPQGIWVSGTGEITVVPDIATIRLGIVAQEATVAEAQSRASEAMNGVMQVLADRGVDQKDIRTGFFRISQRTRFDEQRQMEVVIGYQVTNIVTVTIRDIDEAGNIIDAVVRAGGDLIRINGISFSVDDPSEYYQQAREEAIADAREKAEQLARLAGVTLGRPTYIAEGIQQPIIFDSFRGIETAVPAPLPAGALPPPISPGETQITLSVQVAYSVSQ